MEYGKTERYTDTEGGSMTDELRKPDIPVIVKLGDDEYTLSPLNANVMTYCEEEFGVGLEQIQELLKQKPHSTLRTILYALLKDNYPEMTKQDIGKLYSLNDYEELTQKVYQSLTGEAKIPEVR